ncbi:MAG TPA: hypothetical protein VL128_02025, partial [Candidatus Eisenbacteria bacterium]|nr:hypothetical protein [Candidatus Eisenbacteria bacterium]
FWLLMLAASWLSVLFVESTVTVTGAFVPTLIWNVPGEIVVELLASASGQLRRLHHSPLRFLRRSLRILPGRQAPRRAPGPRHSGRLSGIGRL